jgi:drug/metabolite transporter (DMT)-like permease
MPKGPADAPGLFVVSGMPHVHDPSASPIRDQLSRNAPAILGASAFACADVLGKVTLNAGAEVLTLATARSFIGLALLYAWLQVGARPEPITRRAKWISFGLGVLFTGNVYWLFKSFEAIEVPVAVLTYFVYPLLTGFAAAATGVERLTWRGIVVALTAFGGLALMIGVHPGGIATVGIVAALAAAGCRVAMLLITRATLAGTDARLITWYSLLSSTALFSLLVLATWRWVPPAGALGWIALIGLGVTTTVGILAVYVSTVRIGPFRTALFMNLEPLLTAIGSAAFLGEVLTPLQMLGGAIMLAALVSFQVRR